MQYSEGVSFILKFNWKIGLLTALLLPVLVYLGFWQLQRAQEKRQLLIEFQQHWDAEPVDIDSLVGKPFENHRPVRLTGSFSQQKWFLLDNKIQHGRVGYEVLVPFYTREGNWVVIDRGWVPAPPRRDQRPEVRHSQGEVTVLGRIYRPGETIVLSDNLVSGDSWPKIIQSPDIRVMEKLLKHRLLPVLVHIDAADAAAFAADWKPVNISPEKHLGYAWQWFSMATVLGILFLISSSNIVEVLRAYFKKKGKAKRKAV